MATCPTCGASYDDVLTFCIADGSRLVREVGAGQASGSAAAADPATVYVPPTAPAVAPASAPGTTLNGVFLGMLGTLAVVLLVVLGFLLLRPTPGSAPAEEMARAESLSSSDGPGTEPDVVRPVPPAREDPVAEVGIEPSPRVRPPSPRETSVTDRDDHVAFAREYLVRLSTNDIGGLVDLYANRVHYYSNRSATRSDIADDKSYYFGRWPNRWYRLASSVRATTGREPVLRFDYTFDVSSASGDRRSDGRAWVELRLTPSGDGYAIASEQSEVY